MGWPPGNRCPIPGVGRFYREPGGQLLLHCSAHGQGRVCPGGKVPASGSSAHSPETFLASLWTAGWEGKSLSRVHDHVPDHVP